MHRRLTGLSFLHPLLLAAYPILHLLATNQEQIPLSAGIRSLAVSLLLAGLLLGVLALLLRDLQRAALATSLILLLIFSYGHIYDGLKQIGVSGTWIVRHRYLVPLWAVGIGFCVVAARRVTALARATATMGLVALAGVALPIFQIGWQAARSLALADATSQQESCSLPPIDRTSAPDIYLIIMDSYERADILRELHGFDNEPFLQQLRSRGFYVAEGALSNYRFTALSLVSLLNMDYIQNFPERYSRERDYAWGIAPLIPRNRVRRELECIGYTTVALETGTQMTGWADADYYIEIDPSLFGDLRLLGSATDFEAVLADSTLARAFLDGLRNRRAAAMPSELDPASQHRQRILFQFDQLMQIPRLPSPKLVYAHILAPHLPIVFGRNGESISEGEFNTTSSDYGGEVGAYADEVAYLDQRLLQIVDGILAQSKSPPVIVIMGDHGWAHRSHEDKHKILNTIYLPGGPGDSLYPTITPVNTFRVVLNRYLGGNFDLLPDVSYWSTVPGMFRFEVVPNSWAETE